MEALYIEFFTVEKWSASGEAIFLISLIIKPFSGQEAIGGSGYGSTGQRDFMRKDIDR